MATEARQNATIAAAHAITAPFATAASVTASGAARLARFENHSGYDTSDLARFVRAGLSAYGVAKPVHVVITASPIRSRGCADVGGHRLSIAIASPSRFDRRRLARLIEHEAAHLRGLDHEDMPHDLLYSLGPTPVWAVALPLRHRGRAPNQLEALGS